MDVRGVRRGAGSSWAVRRSGGPNPAAGGLRNPKAMRSILDEVVGGGVGADGVERWFTVWVRRRRRAFMRLVWQTAKSAQNNPLNERSEIWDNREAESTNTAAGLRSARR